MKAKLGIAPIAWSNDDLPELGGETTLLKLVWRSQDLQAFQVLKLGVSSLKHQRNSALYLKIINSIWHQAGILEQS